MTVLKQILATIFFFKFIEILFDFFNMDVFIFSNEEIAIAILFYLFILYVKKSFGENIYKGLMEKGEYIFYLHERFSNENYIGLNSKKKNISNIFNIASQFPIKENKSRVEKIVFFRKKLFENQIKNFYENQFSQLRNLSKQNIENLQNHAHSTRQNFLADFFLKNTNEFNN